LLEIAEKKRVAFGINEKALKAVPEDVMRSASTITDVESPELIPCRPYSDSHLATSAPCEFAPTAAILGGLLAQDILRALSRKEKPIMNLLCVDTMGGNGAVTRWGLSEEVDV
jgi:ubiquitin-like 1-activating enzyme E1 A